MSVRGDGVQGIDWPAPGRASVVVPLLAFADASPLSVTVNGRPVRLDVQALGDADPDPPALSAFWQQFDPLPPAGPAVDPDLAADAADWRPDRSAAVRSWTVTAVVVAVLVVAIARHADPKRATAWLLLAGAGLAVGAVWLRPADHARRELRAEGRPGWQCVWHAGKAGQAVEEPWTAGLRVVPATEDVRAADPVLICDASGRPVALRVRLSDAGRAVFMVPDMATPK